MQLMEPGLPPALNIRASRAYVEEVGPLWTIDQAAQYWGVSAARARSILSSRSIERVTGYPRAAILSVTLRRGARTDLMPAARALTLADIAASIASTESEATRWRMFLEFGRGAAEVGRAALSLIEAEPILTGEPRYAINGQPVARSDIFHLRAPAILHTHIAESPVMQCREAIGVALAMERHAGDLFGNGARPSGILKFTGKLGADVAKRIAASWASAFGRGGDGRGATAVIEEGGDFTPLTFSSVDSQFLELRRFQISEIARGVRVPPHMLYDLERGTWANVQFLGIEFVQYSLSPWINRWQDEIALKLFSVDERRNYFVRFDTGEFLKADMAVFAQAIAQMIAARAMNPNEARAMMNLPPYPGGEKFENPNTLSLSTTPKIPGVKDDDNAA